MTDFVLHGGIIFLLTILQIPLPYLILLMIGKEIADFLDYGLFSNDDIVYGMIGWLLGIISLYLYRKIK